MNNLVPHFLMVPYSCDAWYKPGRCPGPGLGIRCHYSSRLSPVPPGRAAQCAVELETKVHTKVRNHGEGAY